jgi:rhamnosyltransferase
VPAPPSAVRGALKSSPKVLVLLAAYNGETWIREQITSILAQRDVAVSVLVSDDGSTDKTREAIQEFAVDGRVTLRQSVSPTGSAGQNFFSLISSSSADACDFVAFADQDDIWYPDKLSRACKALFGIATGGYSSATLAIWPDGRRRKLSPSSHIRRLDFMFESAGQGCTYVLTADLFARVKDFCANNATYTKSIYFHDWAIYAISRCWTIPWIFDQEATLTYRQHSANDTGARASIMGLLRRVRLLRSGWYVGQLHAVCALTMVAAAQPSASAQHWNVLLHARPSMLRRCRIAKLCVVHARRRLRDRLVLSAAALAGWI